jgi:hypothetical protein
LLRRGQQLRPYCRTHRHSQTDRQAAFRHQADLLRGERGEGRTGSLRWGGRGRSLPALPNSVFENYIMAEVHVQFRVEITLFYPHHCNLWIGRLRYSLLFGPGMTKPRNG